MSDQEKFSDPLDQASRLQEEMNNEAIQKYRRAAAPETHPDFDGETCVECGVDIPETRLTLGKVRCFECQTVLERKKRLGV